jgi:predicted membrane protein
MSDTQPDGKPVDHPPPPVGGWNLPALLTAIAVTLVLTVYPHVAVRQNGSPDMIAAALLFYAMSAGFVRGVGFIPRNRIARAMLSLPAVWMVLAAGVWRLAEGWSKFL